MKVRTVHVHPPRPGVGLLPVQLPSIIDGQVLERVVVRESSISGAIARSVAIEACLFDKVELSSSHLKKSQLTDCRFDHSLLIGSNFDGSGWRRVEIADSNGSGLVVSDCSLQDIVFIRCKLTLANFRVSKFTRVIFRDCDLSEADFQGADFVDVRLDGCKLDGADFSHAKLKNVDLRGSELANIHGIAGLKGATIDSGQLMTISAQLAYELGINVDA